MRRALLLLLTACLFAGLVSTAAARPTGEASARLVGLETSLVQQINAVRSARGLNRLALSPALARAANSHSAAMLAAGVFAHESPNGTPFGDRLKRFYTPRGAWTVGENLAMFGGVEPSAEEVVRMWLGSPAHRVNLLRPGFRELGLGVRHTADGTGVYSGMPAWVITLDMGARASLRSR